MSSFLPAPCSFFCNHRYLCLPIKQPPATLLPLPSLTSSLPNFLPTCCYLLVSAVMMMMMSGVTFGVEVGGLCPTPPTPQPPLPATCLPPHCPLCLVACQAKGGAGGTGGHAIPQAFFPQDWVPSPFHFFSLFSALCWTIQAGDVSMRQDRGRARLIGSDQ